MASDWHNVNYSLIYFYLSWHLYHGYCYTQQVLFSSIYFYSGLHPTAMRTPEI